MMRIHQHQYKELLLLLSDNCAERIGASVINCGNDIVELRVSNELIEIIMDELADVLSAKGIDSNGHINNFGMSVEGFIDLFNSSLL